MMNSASLPSARRRDSSSPTIAGVNIESFSAKWPSTAASSFDQSGSRLGHGMTP